MDRRLNVIKQLSALSTRAKLAMVIALTVVTPLAAWAGYNFGYWLGHN